MHKFLVPPLNLKFSMLDTNSIGSGLVSDTENGFTGEEPVPVRAVPFALDRHTVFS